jgi:hypothetical protein
LNGTRNQTQIKEKKILKYFQKGDQFEHQKINEKKNTFLALTNSKIKIFLKFKKQMMILIT